jgi:hypothetical protein
MASCNTFACSHCRYSIEAWDDGNPYFISFNGRKQTFYHPCEQQRLESYKMQYMHDALHAIASQLQDEQLAEMLKFEFETLGKHRTATIQDLSYLIQAFRERVASLPTSLNITMPDYDGLNERIGNIANMLCLDCGREFKRDLEREKAVCSSRKCKSANIVDVCELDEKPCPKCRQGVFKVDPDQWIVS